MALYPAGKLNRRVTFERRRAVAAVGRAGNERAEWEVFCTRWANVFEGELTRQNEGGTATPVTGLKITVRDDASTRLLSIEDRVIVHDRAYPLTGIGLPDRLTGVIRLEAASRPI
jgi:head-tail adaptor